MSEKTEKHERHCAKRRPGAATMQERPCTCGANPHDPPVQTVETASQHLLNLTPNGRWEDWLPARDALISAVRAEAQREAFEAGLETERVYAGEGGWEWFHKPSGNISKGKDAAFAAYLTRQAGQKGQT